VQLQDRGAHDIVALPLEHCRELTQILLFVVKVEEALDPVDLSRAG
jgi:hypothetical protein